MCLNTVTDIKTLNTVPGDNFNADIELGYEKNFHNGLSDYDNDSLYILIIPTLSEESSILMIADEDDADHIPKNSQPRGRSQSCAQGAGART